MKLDAIQISSRSKTDILRPGEVNEGLQLTAYDGLGVVGASISFSPAVNRDGDVYKSSRLTSRNIMLNIALVRDYIGNRSVSEVRSEFFRSFPPKSQIQVTLLTDEGAYSVSGYVESVESNPFTQTPDLAMSILAESPYFAAEEELSIEIPNTFKEDVFTTTFFNPGTVSSGGLFLFRSKDFGPGADTTTNININGRRITILDKGAWTYRVNTNAGRKSIERSVVQNNPTPPEPVTEFELRFGVWGPGSEFISIEPGENTLSMDLAVVGSSGGYYDGTITYRPQIGGIG